MLGFNLRLLFLTLFVFCTLNTMSFATEREIPLPTDTRIKTFIYNPNEIYTVKFASDNYLIIELQEDEKVDIISFSESGSWKIQNVDNRLFIRAAYPDISTHMTIMTTKRTYSLDIYSVSKDSDLDDSITYKLNFFYPDLNVDVPPSTAKLAKIALNKKAVSGGKISSFVNEKVMASAGAMNTNYSYSGEGKNIIPVMVFDNGTKTYFKFTDLEDLPIISAVNEKMKEIPLRIHTSGEYVYVDTIEQQFTIRKGKELICIFNEAEEKTVAYLNTKK